jgi:hypothetical protein
LPHLYREVAAPEGTQLAVSVTGEAGGKWVLQREERSWYLYYGQAPAAAAWVELDQDTAWRLFTKGLKPEETRSRVQVEGDTGLGSKLFSLVSIMA